METTHEPSERAERPHAEPDPINPGQFRRALRAIDVLFTPWFRPEVHGLHHLHPGRGALLVSNHGPFGLDVPLLIKVIYERRGRFVRSMGDRIFFRLPTIGRLVSQLGVIEGRPETAVHLLQRDRLVLAYPGGAREAGRSQEERYQLSWDGHYGFVRVALRAQRPIIPIACIGIDDVYVRLMSREQVRQTCIGRFMAHAFGEKYVMPLCVGLGPLPLPRKVDYYIGPPIEVTDPPGAADDDAVVHMYHGRVRETLEAMISHAKPLCARRHRALPTRYPALIPTC